MRYVDQVLQPGEVVLSRTRLHWFIYLRPMMGIFLAVAVFVASVFAAPEFRPYIRIGAAGLCIIALWGLFLAWIKRLSTELAVTNHRVIHKTGFFSRNTQEMNREKVESVDVRQSLAGRLFGYGTIFVRGVGSTWEPFGNIADPLQFRSNITAP
jgi:uncharacterized membrane protein YdbT with pleckstrin-like domain